MGVGLKLLTIAFLVSVFSMAVLAPPVGGGGHFSDPDSFLLPPGVEVYNSEALLTINDNGRMEDVILNGPTVIRRGPQEGGTLPTEIIHMELTGSSPLLGPVIVRQNQTQPSRGLIDGQTDHDGDIIYPTNSFFDVFFEINLPEGDNLRNSQPARLFGMASDELLPDNEHSTNTPTEFSDRQTQRTVVVESIRLVTKPVLEKKIGKVVIKKNNKIVILLLQIYNFVQKVNISVQNTYNNTLTIINNVQNIYDNTITIINNVTQITRNMNLGASKSIVVNVPAKSAIIVGAGVSKPNVPIENPFERDSNIKLCVDATEIRNGTVELWLDVAGNGSFSLFERVQGNDLKKIKNTCFITAAREFQVKIENPSNQPADAEVAIIWSTGANQP